MMQLPLRRKWKFALPPAKLRAGESHLPGLALSPFSQPSVSAR